MSKLDVRKVVQLLFWAMLVALVGFSFDLEFGEVTYTLELSLIACGVLILIATSKHRNEYKYMNRLFFAGIALIACSILAPALMILVSPDVIASLEYFAQVGPTSSTMNNEELVELLNQLGSLSGPLTLMVLIGVVVSSLPLATCIYYTGRALHEVSTANRIENSEDLGKIKKLSYRSGLFYTIGMVLAIPLIPITFSMFSSFELVDGEILVNEGGFTISILLMLVLVQAFIALLILHLVNHIKLLVQIQRMSKFNDLRDDNVVEVIDEPLE